MQAIGRLTSLVDLDLGFLSPEMQEEENSQISEKGYAHLARLTNLRRLNLGSRNINDAVLQYFEGLENLTELVLTSDQITDAGLPHLARLLNLTKLVLTSHQITEEGRAWLKERLPNAEIID